MSTIQKIAVYDARLQQDEPAYAVQKGALSVSVAPFNAISATSSQMTFQVLVPSLNVFVDRKIQLRTGFNFTANLLFSGSRGPSTSVLGFLNIPPSVTTITTGVDGVTTMAISNTNRVVYTLGGVTYSQSATVDLVKLPVGTQVVSLTATQLPPNIFIVSATSAFVYILSQPLTATWTGSIAAAELGFILPPYYDVPDVSLGVTASSDSQFTGAFNSESYQPLGYCTAVGPKDLCLTQFPLQSSMINMTATLNDCTVTTNGDTLREQLILTQTPENFKQRTTPTNPDVYAWGRDDVLANSGNFSSYAVTNSYGDIPNGAWPIVWYGDSAFSKPLISATTSIVTKSTAIAGYPFVAVGTASGFNVESDGSTALAGSTTGIGWYIAKQGTPWSNASTAPNTTVVVPFVSGQPVWTTGFPGGDLLWSQSKFGGATFSATNPGGATGHASGKFAGFTLTSTQLTLLQAVPPYCMIGARLYFTNTGGYATATPTYSGWISSIASGALGALGSVYNIVSANDDAAAGTFGTTALGVLSTNATGGGIALQAGWNAYWGVMPVFGQVQVTEALVLSPYSWADSAEFQTVGLYGMTNLQFVMNFTKPSTAQALWLGASAPNSATSNRSTSAVPIWGENLNQQYPGYGNILRSSNVRSIISDMDWGTASATTGPWINPALFVDFLTPGPDITLPLVSTVPYVEFPRYVSTYTNTGDLKDGGIVNTQTISLTSIPDMIMCYIKPATRGPSQLDTYVPIRGCTVTFDNFSNLCSGFQQFNLYESAVAAGLPLDWHQWRGYTQGEVASVARITANNAVPQIPITYKQAPVTQLSGGPLLLRMGHDITLSPGLAPGCLGNYSIQVSLTVDNKFGFFDYCNQYSITLVAINTGFFETVRGQSAIRKTILNSADVEAATPETGLTKTHLNRMVGRGNFFSGASNLVHRGLTAARAAKKFAQDNDLSGMARTYGGHYGGMAADAADAAMNMVPSGSGMKRHRASGL